MRKFLLTMIALTFVVGCADDKAPRLMAPPAPDPKPQPIVKGEATATGLDIVFNSKVDILFIIDNSRSMEEDILTLKQNINAFVRELSQNSVMDYHIAATTVFDSMRFTDSESGVFKKDPTDPTKTLYLNRGELIPLKDNDGRRLWSSPRYVTRRNLNLLPSLFEVVKYDDPNKSSFELLVDYVSKNKKETVNGVEKYTEVAYGPNSEETLSPIYSLIFPDDPTVRNSANGFLRDDSLFVIIPLTDADSEDHKFNPADLYRQIAENRNNDILGIGLLCPTVDVSAVRSANCRRKDPTNPNSTALEPQSRRIREFIRATRDNLPEDRETLKSVIPAELEIGSSSWGQQLAKVGSDIKKQILKKTVSLGDSYPRFDPSLDAANDPFKRQQYLIEVFYGETMLPNNKENGWFYNVKTNEITISENIDAALLEQDNVEIQIRFFAYKEGSDSEYYQGPSQTSDSTEGAE